STSIASLLCNSLKETVGSFKPHSAIYPPSAKLKCSACQLRARERTHTFITQACFHLFVAYNPNVLFFFFAAQLISGNTCLFRIFVLQ
ncbi:hypothetical protein L9F63_003781, partial [Diploptera punctata]